MLVILISFLTVSFSGAPAPSMDPEMEIYLEGEGWASDSFTTPSSVVCGGGGTGGCYLNFSISLQPGNFPDGYAVFVYQNGYFRDGFSFRADGSDGTFYSAAYHANAGEVFYVFAFGGGDESDDEDQDNAAISVSLAY